MFSVCLLCVYGNIGMCAVIGPMFPIKFKMLTIQVKTRERKKKLFFFALRYEEICLLLLISSEMKRKIRVKRQRGVNLCVRRLELGKTETVLLYSSQKSHQPLSRMLKAVPWLCVQRLWDGGRVGPGGRKRRERRCWRGWGRCRKNKTVTGQRKGGWV